MNERIRELADQAGIHFGRSAALDGNNIARFVTTSDMEKFAELIVRECMKLNHEWFSDEDPYTIDSTYRQHFGIEE